MCEITLTHLTPPTRSSLQLVDLQYKYGCGTVLIAFRLDERSRHLTRLAKILNWPFLSSFGLQKRCMKTSRNWSDKSRIMSMFYGPKNIVSCKVPMVPAW